MRRSVSEESYGKNFDEVRQRLNIACKPGERFLFFYGDRLETNGLGRVFACPLRHARRQPVQLLR